VLNLPLCLQADASLAEVHALQHLPHFLYSLLHGPLLQAPGPNLAPAAASLAASPWQHPDRAAAMRALLRVLPPDELSVAVCPQLSSWASPDEVAVLHHSLSAAALAVSQQPIWVLDTFLQLVVLDRGSTTASSSSSSSATAAGAQPPQFPPPAASLLRRTLAGIRQVRRATPELLMLQQGVGDTMAFNAWLIEDAPPAEAWAADQQQQQQRGRGDEEGQQQQQLQWPSFVAFLNAAGSQAQHLLQEDR
jgi:hypothetical protein